MAVVVAGSGPAVGREWGRERGREWRSWWPVVVAVESAALAVVVALSRWRWGRQWRVGPTV